MSCNHTPPGALRKAPKRLGLLYFADAPGRVHGLRPLRFHDLRHTFGSVAIRTADPRELQEWMGHSDFSTTQIYMHYRPRADAARRLSAAFGADVVTPSGQPLSSSS